MADLSEALPPKNHNNPPALDPLEELSENLALRHISLIRQSEEYAAIGNRIPQEFKEEGEATYTSDFIKRVTESIRQLRSEHKAEKEPHLRKGQMVDRFFGDIIGALEATIGRAEYPLKNYMQKLALEEQRRRDAEALELRQAAQSAARDIAIEQTPESVERAVDIQHAAAVAEKIAAVPVQTMASVQTKTSRAGLKKQWIGEIRDIGQVDLEKLRPYFSEKHLQVALNAAVKAGLRECAGAVIKEETDVKVR